MINNRKKDAEAPQMTDIISSEERLAELRRQADARDKKTPSARVVAPQLSRML
jgi:hypothetical protein